MGKRKLIASDLDGTLLGKNGKISQNSCDYLRKLKDEGHVIVIATGRMMNNAVLGTEGADFANYILTDNGAVVFDVDNARPLFRNVLNEEHVRKVCDMAEDKYIRLICLASPNFNYIYTAPGAEHFDYTFAKYIYNREELLKYMYDISKMNIAMKSFDFAEYVSEEIKKTLPELDVLIMFDSFRQNEKWIEVMNKGTSKYNSIKKISEIEGIPNEDIITFGDSTNDIEMIKGSGVGVAVGNAIEELKMHADHIAPLNIEDGVVEFLKEYFK